MLGSHPPRPASTAGALSLAVAVFLGARAVDAIAAPPDAEEGAPGPSVRFGDRTVEETVRTDERYGHDPLFQGPRGWSYWNQLEDPKPIQNPNLWPDTKSTYFIARLAMPEGSTLTLRGRYPSARYFQLAFYKAERGTFVSIGESLSGEQIEPDPGSTNPYLVGSDRLAPDRDFSIRIVAEEAPADPASRGRNTLYVGRDGGELEAVLRIYLADQDRDGAGWGPANASAGGGGFLSYEGTLADGSTLSAEQVARQFGRPISGETEKPMTADQWVRLVRDESNDPSVDPEAAPARNPPRWEKFWTLRYSLAGAFKAPERRAEIPFEGPMEGGGQGPYLMTLLSRKYGPVYVMKGKMPTFPDTYAGPGGRGLRVMPEAQTRYWSVVSCEAAPSGQVVDGLTDFQVPLDGDRNYTIVVSRPEDRPSNATPEHGVAWMAWSPRGEGLEDPRNRADFGMLIMRIMGNDPGWEHRPDAITAPGTEEAVMGPYYPVGTYMTRAEFEQQGPRGEPDAREGEDRVVTPHTFEDTRDQRFGEILVVFEDRAEIYNTTGLNDCPAELWDSMDLEKVREEHGARLIQLNGPHYWMMDTMGASFGETKSFGGIEARWGATVDPALLAGSTKGARPYTVFNPKKTQKMVYKKGKPVFELVDPDGHSYVLQAREDEFPIETLGDLGSRMTQLPEGWSYRSRILEEDLVLDLGPDETIYGVGDEFRQYYTRIPDAP